MGDQETLQIARQMEDAFVAADWDAYSAVLSDDITLQAPTANLHGKDEVLNFAQRLKEGFPDLNATVTNAIVAGDSAVLEISYELTHTQDFHTPRGTVPATNRRATFKAAKVVDVRNGKIVSSRQYFDLGSVTAKLGEDSGALRV